ncbi:MAG: DUF1801 domain-containing protein [Cyclobacteriaceae bacterium]|jgi:hypothetical protein|nr:DUF1801 domain-containing protein [Cyclobacteriaceae bacterium]
MTSTAETVSAYIQELPTERKKAVEQLRKAIKKNLPKGFVEEMNYGMIGYVVPHTLYPAGYHCDPKLPLPFLSVASQKNFIAVYHMALYTGALLDWFLKEWNKEFDKKPDMGKSCLRFKKPEEIPFELIGKLASKLTPQQWIKEYEKNLKSK